MLISFEEAIAQSHAEGKRPHVLLGNGFSRACRNDIFAYDALFERADFRTLSPTAREVFEVLDTVDFEEVMRGLDTAAKLVELYAPGQAELVDRLRQDSLGLREVLVKAIAESHPDLPSAIPRERYAACRRFLSKFDKIFTLNYDLLLYWALMQVDLEPEVPCDDGFRTPEDPAPYVTWEPENIYNQNVYYLHGALHLFDSGTEVQKYTWINTGIPLIEQIREALGNGLYPLFVAEGTSKAKLRKIRHSANLARAERALMSIGGTLFVYGHSLSENDDHIYRAILSSKVTRLWISIYGNPESEDNRRKIQRAINLTQRRPHNKKKPLEVGFFSAESARVWG